MNALFKGSKLEVMNKKMIFKKYKSYGPGGLIEVFLQPRFVRDILLWTNQSLHQKGKLEISCDELKSFISLEIAMSIVRINKIKNYWSSKVFLGNSDFKNIMSRDKFCYIRSNIMFHPPFMNEFDSESKNQDPLWNCRHLMQHFQQTFADVAVPMGCSALDEMGSKSKGRSKAISYSPNKPDKYAIRFYSVVGHAWKYTFSVMNDGRGNKTGIPPLDRYLSIFPQLRTPIFKSLHGSEDIKWQKASALWVAQVGHMRLKMKSKTDIARNVVKRTLFCDNFYTRHKFAKVIDKLTDGDVKVTGTIRFNFIEANNK